MSAGTVLLLEDEPLIRSATAEALGDAGYTVVETETAAEALAQLCDNADIGVFVADINLKGGINGCEVGTRALRLRPDLRLVITSGATPDQLPENCAFLAKPYRLAQILDAVAGVDLVRSRG